METRPLYSHADTDWYRIPSVILTNADTVLAFASRRKGSSGDFGHDTDVVLRRSTDGGHTFGPMQTLATRPGHDIHTGPVVIDRASGRILKFCRYWPANDDPEASVRSTPYARMAELGLIDHVMASEDDGITWTDPAPLPLDFPPDSVSCGTGNGNHGIQLRDGRMLIQGGYVALNPNVKSTRHTCLFLSDNAGAAWRMGADVSHSTLREFTMAERPDGSVYVNLRAHDEVRRFRAVTASDDCGESFGPLRLDEQLPDPRCHAGLTGLADGTLVFTNPNPPAPSFYERSDLTARLSRDGGRTWTAARRINVGYAGYSDIVAAPNGTVHCLFESGEDGPVSRMTYCAFTIEDLA